MKKQAMISILFWMVWHTHQSFLFELTQNWGEQHFTDYNLVLHISRVFFRCFHTLGKISVGVEFFVTSEFISLRWYLQLATPF